MWNRFSGNGGSRTASRGLRAVDDLTTAVLASLSDHVAIVDGNGDVIAVNKAWKSYDCGCGDPGLQRSVVGSNYIEGCEAAEQAGAGGVEGAAAGLRAVLDGSRSHFSLTYLCHSPSGQRWFRMTATPIGLPPDGAVISHVAVGEPPPAGEAPLIGTTAPPETGEPLLRVLTENLAKTLGARFAFLSEAVDQRAGRVRLVALWSGEGFEENFEYDVGGTPCHGVLRGELCLYAADVQEAFPDDVWLKEIAAEFYLAVPMFGSAGEVIGHVGVIHDQSLDDLALAEHVVRAVAAQASPELERMRLVRALQKSERTARALLNAPVDTAILLDPDGTIVDLNEVAAVRLGTTVEEAVGRNVFDLFPPELAATRRAAMDKVITSRKPLRMEDERAGMHFESSVCPVLDPQGDVESVAIFASNVTTRKVAEEQLRKSEEKFRLLAENVAEVFWLIDPKDYRVLYVNPAYEELWGRTCESLYEDPRSWLAAAHPADLERVTAALEKQAETGEFNEEFRIIRPDGSIRWVWDRGFAVKDESGQVQHMVGVAADITDRRLAEEALAQSERRLRQVTDHISEMVWLSDPDAGKLLYVNPAYEEIWGRSCQSLYDDPRSWLEAVHPEDLERVKAALGKPEEVFDQEYRIVRPDGSVRWIWDRSFPVREKADGGLRKAGITVDITDRKQVEEELALQARVLESMAEGVNVCDENAKILVTNPTFDEMFGYERGELINQHASVLNAGSPEENARILQDVHTQLEQVGSWSGEFANVRKDGTLFTTSARISTLEMSGKTYLISVQEDITERKQAAEDLRLSAERNASLLGAIPDMIFSVDRRGMYVGFVPGEGVEPYAPTDEFLGSTMAEILPTSLAQDLMREIGLTLDTGRQGRHEYGLERDDGRHEYEARIVKSKDNEALVIVRDVTAVKRLEREEQLRRDRDKLEGTVEKEMLGKNPYGLTFREFTVLHLAANGEADKAIADQLGISTFTVSKHVANILGKMAAASRTEACVRALREGLLT